MKAKENLSAVCKFIMYDRKEQCLQNVRPSFGTRRELFQCAQNRAFHKDGVPGDLRQQRR